LTVPPADPSWTDQLTALDWPEPSPVTEAEKLTIPPVCVEADPGAMETVMFGAGVTVTAAVALLDGSATLVATTWNVPAVPGAVYLPEPSMLPPLAPSSTDQLTSVD
jgi:hypothetical protein